ncbi:MAG: BON domain-containing protein [Planctomycetota bacterium]|jgi:osmotically-inducible protein OsmY
MSTATIITSACHALKRSYYPALRSLSVQGTENALIISGKVATYYMKQLAQEAVMPVRGSLQLVNQVAVESRLVAR